jgi:hypothetical protein
MNSLFALPKDTLTAKGRTAPVRRVDDIAVFQNDTTNGVLR